jgi:hypothetical protein
MKDRVGLKLLQLYFCSFALLNYKKKTSGKTFLIWLFKDAAIFVLVPVFFELTAQAVKSPF